MKRIFVISVFSLFTLGFLYMAATSETIAVAFVYVLFTLIGGVLVSYFAFCKS